MKTPKGAVVAKKVQKKRKKEKGSSFIHPIDTTSVGDSSETLHQHGIGRRHYPGFFTDTASVGSVIQSYFADTASVEDTIQSYFIDMGSVEDNIQKLASLASTEDIIWNHTASSTLASIPVEKNLRKD